MSFTPVFDAVVADSEPDLFLASSIFPRPIKFPTLYDDRIDSILYSWACLTPHWRSKVLGVFRTDLVA